MTDNVKFDTVVTNITVFLGKLAIFDDFYPGIGNSGYSNLEIIK
ncbi:hypothetical protein QUB68_06995 [Microcoleus sp. A006_D1]